MGNGADDEQFKAQVAVISKNYTSDEDKKILDEFMNENLQEIDEMMTELEQILSIKQQMSEVSEIVSLSWIAKHYFGKTKNWLYQRINGNIVNGKPSKFTPAEIETLNFALKDISKKIGSLSIHY